MPLDGPDDRADIADRGIVGDDVDDVTDAVLAASRLLVTVSARSIASVDESITIAQFRLLAVLWSQHPRKVVSLAEYLGVNPSTATRMVDRLVTAGLLSRAANPASRRELVVELTEKGRQVVRDVTSHRRAEIADIVARLPAATRQELVHALSAFADAGGHAPAGPDRANATWL